MDDRPFDQHAVAERLRDLLADEPGISERTMFGTQAFFAFGNLICGPNRDSLLVRVGADGYEAALAEPDAEPMQMGERTMRGFVRVPFDDMDDARLEHWFAMGYAVASALPPKP